MDTKFTLQDLAVQLELTCGLDKTESQVFIRAFLDHIIQGLETDKYVKVKGLGTFKLVEVDSRESVNVNTGERFVIDGHAKITFLPDNSLKELVNKPFAHFDTVTLEDDVSEDELSEVDLRFSQMEAMPEPAEPIEEPELPVGAANSIDEPEPEATPNPEVAEEPKGVDLTEEPKEPEENDEPEESEEPEVPEESEATEEPVEAEPANHPVLVKVIAPVQVDVAAEHPVVSEPVATEPAPNSSEKHFRSIWMVLCLVALLLGYLLGFFRVLSPLGSMTPAVVHDTVVLKKVVHDTIRVQSAEIDSLKQSVSQPSKVSSKAPVSSASVSSQTNPVNPDIPQVKGGAYIIVGTKSTYTMKAGETIRIIAERYYGSRQMALYISTYNRIDDPDRVAVGTVLKIPELKQKQKRE